MIFDGDDISETCTNAEDTHLAAFRKLSLAFLDENLAWVIAPKARIDELNLIATDLDGLEESERR